MPPEPSLTFWHWSHCIFALRNVVCFINAVWSKANGDTLTCAKETIALCSIVDKRDSGDGRDGPSLRIYSKLWGIS